MGYTQHRNQDIREENQWQIGVEPASDVDVGGLVVRAVAGMVAPDSVLCLGLPKDACSTPTWACHRFFGFFFSSDI